MLVVIVCLKVHYAEIALVAKVLIVRIISVYETKQASIV